MAMNIFRFTGDMCHVAAILLLLKMVKTGNTSSISLKAQELYLIVFICRYLDLFTMYYSFYNSFMKIFFIVSTGVLVCILRGSEPAQSTYSPAHDSFQHWKYLLVPSIIIGLSTHIIGSDFDFDLMEGLWTISIYLEAVTMLPQLIMFRSDRFVKGNRGEKKDDILLPIFLFGIYRAFYILNWIYRANTERRYRHHWVVYICGSAQVLLYSQFFHLWCKSTICPSNEDETEESDLESPLINDDTSSEVAEVEITEKQQGDKNELVDPELTGLHLEEEITTQDPLQDTDTAATKDEEQNPAMQQEETESESE